MSATTIRQETIQNLGLAKNKALLLRLTQAADKFCKYNDFGKVSLILYRLLYEDDNDIRENALHLFGFTMSSEKSFEFELFFIPNEQVGPIAEELQFQYKAAHPLFSRVNNYPGCEEELNVLKDKLGEKHQLLLFKAVNSAWDFHQKEDEVAKCVALLSSTNPKSQERGLKMLGHNPSYQKLLLPYAKDIGSLLQAMYNMYMEQQQRITAAQEELNIGTESFKPLRELLTEKTAVSTKLEKTAPTPTASDTRVEKPAGKSTDPTPNVEKTAPVCAQSAYIREYTLSPELKHFIANKPNLVPSIPISEEFWEYLKQLRELGIDLNLLVEHLHELYAVLNAHDELEKAADCLNLANQEYEAARTIFLKDEESKNGENRMKNLQALLSTGKKLEDSKPAYNAAYENFEKLCKEFENVVAKS